jgi:hypothetical protein
MNHDTPKRSRALWPLLVLAPLLFTCGGLTVIDVDVEGRTVIPQRSVLDELIGPLTFLGFEGFDITESQEFQNEGYTKDEISSVRMRSFTLTIADPDGADFDFLQRISFSVSAPGLPTVELARLDPVPRGAGVIELEVEDAFELVDYVVAPSMTLTATATGERPEQQTTVDADAVFRVDVKLSAACN